MQSQLVSFSASFRALTDATPRRHFLLQTESQHWLRAPPISPSSSRAVTPERERKHSNFSSLAELNDVKDAKRASPSLSGMVQRQGNVAKEAGPDDVDRSLGKLWIRWMYRNHMKEGLTVCSVLATLWLKWCVGMGSYSGAGTPPMFGDYEAQRHWMEITQHLPPSKWYTYDLQYWGLDYPPLTAYHSYLCGLIGSLVNPAWFTLDTSRGIETEESKLFMRYAVLATDLVIYIPALIYFVRSWHGSRSNRTQSLALLTLLLQPSLILIDNGHFQFNSAMLGFTVLALDCFSRGYETLGAVFFVASLGFKQMSLYYAPAFGSYLLGRCLSLGRRAGTATFLRLGFTTILSFYLIFGAFLPPFAPLRSVLDPLVRIFPFSRGLFEDKVANMWCATNVVLKWRAYFTQSSLVRLSAAFTALGFTPAVLNLLVGSWKATAMVDQSTTDAKKYTTPPTLPILPWALLTSSLSFFLFSFQVHEKTILLPLLPLNLLMSGASPGSFTFEWGALVNNVAVFSMWPLLRRDGAAVPYVALTFLWNRVIGYNPFRKPARRSYVRYVALFAYGTMALLHALEILVDPPSRYPDLFPVLNVLLCAPIFGITWLWSIKRSTEVTWAISGIGLRHSRTTLQDAKDVK